MKSKQGYMFRVHFDSFGTGDAYEFLSEQVMRVTRPEIVFSDILGLHEAAMTDFDIELRDDITDRARAEVITQVNKQIREDAEFALTIDALDDQGAVVEQWYLRGCKIAACRLGELTKGTATNLTIYLVVTSRRVATSLFGQSVQVFD